MKQADFLQSLQQDLDDIAERTNTSLIQLDNKKLNWRPAAEKWSVAEIFAHLNSYCDYYLPEFEKAIEMAKSNNWKSADEYKSTWLGRYIIKSMSPDTIDKKATALRQHNYMNSKISKDVVMVFMENQKRLRSILENAATIDINKAKVSIEFFKLLKLRLGDFLSFFLAHEQRHMIQIMNNERLRKKRSSSNNKNK